MYGSFCNSSSVIALRVYIQSGIYLLLALLAFVIASIARRLTSPNRACAAYESTPIEAVRMFLAQKLWPKNLQRSAILGPIEGPTETTWKLKHYGMERFEGAPSNGPTLTLRDGSFSDTQGGKFFFQPGN